MVDATTVIAVPVKPFYKSITLWLNGIGFLSISLEIVLENARLIDLPTQAVGVLSLILLLLNGWRRFATSQPIGQAGSTTVLSVPTAAVSLPSNDKPAATRPSTQRS